jgi:hypothetical protein
MQNGFLKPGNQIPTLKSLKFKKTHSKENIYSIRIGISWRTLVLKRK